MEISEIWLSIIMPLILGPIFVFFKTIWDRTRANKDRKQQMLFDDTRNRLKHQLDEFYYPVYLKLLLLYSISFILPQKETEGETDALKNSIEENRGSISSSESEFCSSDEEVELETKQKRKSISYRKKRCMAYYKINNEYIKCRNVIPTTGFSKICKTCRWKFLGGKIEISLLDETDIHRDSVFYVPSNENNDKRLSVDKDTTLKLNHTETLQKRTKRNSRKSLGELKVSKDITIQMPDFIDISELELGDKHKDSIVNQMNLLSISISEKTIPIIEAVCNEYYKEIAESIEAKIHIIEPNTRLTKHLILFLKYAKIRDLIHHHSLSETDCKPEDFGAKNNINNLLGHIEANLNKYGNQYKNLMEKGTI